MNHTFQLLTAAALFLLPLFPKFAVAQSSERATTFGRLAVIANESVPQELQDLLVVELTAGGFELVAREELLELVSDERVLQSLASNRSASVRVGTVSRADVLLLLESAEVADGTLTSATFLETRYGARLGRWLYEDDIVTVSKQIAAKSLALRQNYSEGVRQIVAVPPFLSLSLSHRYDDLQSSLSSYLSDLLRAVPGVLVVEWEQADAIIDENALTGPITERPNLKIVQASYRFDELDSQQVSCEVEIHAGTKTSRLQITTTPQNLPQWLSSELLPALFDDNAGLDKSTAQPGKNELRAQAEDFVRKADRFAELGQIELASRLREAALVVAMDDVLLRRTLLREYWILIKRQLSLLQTNRYLRTLGDKNILPNQRMIERVREDHADAARDLHALGMRYMQHAEWLLRNGHVENRIEFRKIVRDIRGVPILNSPRFRNRLVEFTVYSAKKWFDIPIQKTTRAQLDFLAHRDQIDATEWWLAAPRTLHVAYWHSLDSAYLDAHAELVELYPAGRLPHSGLALNIPTSWQIAFTEDLRGKVQRPNQRRASQEQQILAQMARVDATAIDDYLDRLQRSPKLTARLCASLGRIRLLLFLQTREFNDERNKDLRSATDQLISQTRELSAHVEKVRQQLRNSLPWDHRHGDYDHFIETIRADLRRVDETLESTFADRLPPLRFRSHGTNERPLPLEKTWGRLTFEKIPLEFDDASRTKLQAVTSGYGSDRITNCRNCGDFDVYWGNHHVFVMKRKGQLERLPIDDWHNTAQSVASVKWDGRYVWFAGAVNRILVLDSHTWKLTALTNLPEHDWTKVACYEPGTAIAVGMIKPEYRIWFARIRIIAHQTGEPTMITNVFHQGRKVPDNASREKLNEQMDLAFRCDWMSTVSLSDGSARVLLGRGQLSPMSIDPRTLKLSVTNLKVSSGYLHGDILYAWSGGLITAYGGKALYASGLDSGNARRLDVVGCRRLVRYDDWIYAFGFNGTIDRIHHQSLAVENLVPTMLPGAYDSCGLGNSAHYGLVAFGDRTSEDGLPNIFSVSVGSL